MKKNVLVLIMLQATIGFAQYTLVSSDVKTTYEEYNFLTERYGIEDNYQMMEGYSLEDFNELTVENFKYSYQLFIESETKNVKAMFIIITKIKKGEDKVRYLCMPFNNANLLKRFNKEAEGLGISMSLCLDALNRSLLSELLDEKFNTKQ